MQHLCPALALTNKAQAILTLVDLYDKICALSAPCQLSTYRWPGIGLNCRLGGVGAIAGVDTPPVFQWPKHDFDFMVCQCFTELVSIISCVTNEGLSFWKSVDHQCSTPKITHGVELGVQATLG